MRKLAIGVGVVLLAVFVAMIADSALRPDEICDACGTRMVLVAEMADNESYSLHEYRCPKCGQRARLSVNKMSGDSDWWEWMPER